MAETRIQNSIHVQNQDSLRRRRGPVRGQICDESGRLRDVCIRFGTRVTLIDGKRGVVAAIDLAPYDGGPPRCTRMVLVMDDLSTRVLFHGDVIAFYILDVALATGGVLSKGFRSGGYTRSCEFLLPAEKERLYIVPGAL